MGLHQAMNHRPEIVQWYYDHIHRCKECGDIMPHKTRWYVAKRTGTGIPYPSVVECPHFENKPDAKLSVWNLLDLKEDGVTYDIRRAMFCEWGTKTQDDWLSIDVDGNSSMPIENIEFDSMSVLFDNVADWLKNGIGSTDLTFCQTSTKMGNCQAGFSGNSISPSRNPTCPFARIFDGNSMKWSCCWTTRINGVTLDEVEPILADCISNGTHLNNHDRGNEAKAWLVGMLEFLKKKVLGVI